MPRKSYEDMTDLELLDAAEARLDSADDALVSALYLRLLDVCQNELFLEYQDAKTDWGRQEDYDEMEQELEAAKAQIYRLQQRAADAEDMAKRMAALVDKSQRQSRQQQRELK